MEKEDALADDAYGFTAACMRGHLETAKCTATSTSFWTGPSLTIKRQVRAVERGRAFGDDSRGTQWFRGKDPLEHAIPPGASLHARAFRNTSSPSGLHADAFLSLYTTQHHPTHAVYVLYVLPSAQADRML